MGSISLKYKSKSGNLTAPGDVDPGAMIPIATAIASGSTDLISFTSIPQTYTHLQIRVFGGQPAGYGIYTTFNSDTGASNYADHYLNGDGATTRAAAQTSRANIIISPYAGWGSSGSMRAAGVIDILDYTNTNKYKTLRSLAGWDLNGSGYIDLTSGLWMSTAAITRIDLSSNTSNWVSGSSFALYGIKTAGA